MPRKRRRGGQEVTIREVAARAGVSPMTVSRVINNGANVTDTTRAAVTAAIKELNYSPNPAARRLAGSEAFRIGLLYNNPSAAFLSEFLVGALDECSKSGRQLVIEKCGITPAAERAAIQKLLQGGIRNLILPPPLCEARPVLDEIRKAGATAVIVGSGAASAEFPTVRMDNYKAAREMTAYLLSLGHRRIGFIRGNPNQSVSAQRLQGFVDALSEAGIAPVDGPVEAGLFSYQSGLAAAEKLLARKPRPTAIFAANDDMAAAALSVAHRMGLQVPAQLSVVGFDDGPIAATVWPALTTVRQPIAAMARAAVDLLIGDAKPRGGVPAQRLLRHALAHRESTARA
ncbi:MAG: LacI family DNA-binding transcriptional regulator [Solimonas sp.]